MKEEEKRKIKAYIQAHKSEEEVINLLEQIDVEINLDGGTPLNHAVNYDRTKIVKYLIDRKANVNAKHDGDYTPLMSACEGGNIEIIKLLLKAKADINLKDRFGNNALWKATFNENEEIIKLLLNNGANPYERLSSGESIYESAQRMELENSLKIFEKYKNLKNNAL